MGDYLLIGFFGLLPLCVPIAAILSRHLFR
jgi:hypothetical protein